MFVPPPKDGVTKIQSMDEQVKIDRVRVGNIPDKSTMATVMQ